MPALTSPHEPADVFVIFGISGDLDRKMTLRSLFRLERRGLLNCPIVGVAVDPWSTDDLRKHARDAIAATGEHIDDKVFGRFARRLRSVAGDFAQAATFQAVARAGGDAKTPVYYLEIPPALFASVVDSLAA